MKQYDRLLSLFFFGVSIVLAWLVVTGSPLAHAEEEQDCVAYVLVGYEDPEEGFHTITVEPGNCTTETQSPLYNDMLGGNQ